MKIGKTGKLRKIVTFSKNCVTIRNVLSGNPLVRSGGTDKENHHAQRGEPVAVNFGVCRCQLRTGRGRPGLPGAGRGCSGLILLLKGFPQALHFVFAGPIAARLFFARFS
ncbi:MAG: hypothetical protein OXE80_12515 [Gammaproteobacteria bacterium]|nr:hypothetical protein [Gammaproteobacteria bacterium]